MGTSVDFIAAAPAEGLWRIGCYVGDVLYPGQEQAQRALEPRRERLAIIQGKKRLGEEVKVARFFLTVSGVLLEISEVGVR